jgi:hypothetical protein
MYHDNLPHEMKNIFAVLILESNCTIGHDTYPRASEKIVMILMCKSQSALKTTTAVKKRAHHHDDGGKIQQETAFNVHKKIFYDYLP